MDDFARRGFRLDCGLSGKRGRDMRDRSSPASTSLWRTAWIPTRRSLRFCFARPDRRGCRLGHRQVGQRAGPHDHGVDGRLLVSLPGSSPTPPLGCATATLRAGAARDAGGAELRQPRDGPTGRRRPDRPGTRCPSMLPLGASRAATGRDVVRGARGRGRCRTAVGHGDPVGERLADLDPVAGAAAVQGLLWLELPAAGAKEYKWRLVADGRRVVCDRTARRVRR
jgi:hypothetical protein